MLRLILSLLLLLSFNQVQAKKTITTTIISDDTIEQFVEVKTDVDDNTLKLTN